MLRYLALALPLVLLILTLGGAALALLDLAPDTSPLDARGVGRPEGEAPRNVVLSRLIETVGLVALVLLLSGRTGAWWLDGLACALVAWLFRGPLLVLAVSSLTRLPVAPFFELARGALVLDLAAALAAAGLARLTLSEER